MHKKKPFIIALASMLLLNTNSQAWTPTKEDALLFACGGLAVAAVVLAYKFHELHTAYQITHKQIITLTTKEATLEKEKEKENKKLRTDIDNAQENLQQLKTKMSQEPQISRKDLEKFQEDMIDSMVDLSHLTSQTEQDFSLEIVEKKNALKSSIKRKLFANRSLKDLATTPA